MIDVGLDELSSVNVAAVVDWSSFLQVTVVEEMDFSWSIAWAAYNICAAVAADPWLAYDSGML